MEITVTGEDLFKKVEGTISDLEPDMKKLEGDDNRWWTQYVSKKERTCWMNPRNHERHWS